MSSFLNSFTPKLWYATVVLCLTGNYLFAQCSITKTNKNNSTTIETGEQYEYVRLNNKYYSIAVKSGVLKNNNTIQYYALVKYTGAALGAKPANLIFKFADGHTLSGRLQLVKVEKNDDKKVNTKIYRVQLTTGNVDDINKKQLQQISITLNNNSSPIAIPIQETTFMQQQLQCLQTAAI